MSSCSGDKIEKNEMGGACSAYGGEERVIQRLVGETPGSPSGVFPTPLGDPGIDGRIILRWIFR